MEPRSSWVSYRTVGPGVSWEGHFYGAIAGAAVAYFSTGYTGEESVVEE